jgi:hypothetical protein
VRSVIWGAERLNLSSPVVGGVPRQIDHEAEPADFVFFGGYEKAPLSTALATDANRRHAVGSHL